MIIPSRRMYSTAPVRGLSSWCLRVSLNFTSAHQCPACALRAEDHLEGTKVAVFPSLCAPRERPVRQRSGLAVTEEWRPERRRATWLPEEEQATQSDELSG